MTEQSLRQIMILIAVATPLVGVCLLVVGRSAACQAGGRTPPSIRRNALLLMVAGPVNLLLWLLFNQWLDFVGYRSVIGYALAAVVFFVGGWTTGLFSRLRAGRPRRPLDTSLGDHADKRQTDPPKTDSD